MTRVLAANRLIGLVVIEAGGTQERNDEFDLSALVRRGIDSDDPSQDLD